MKTANNNNEFNGSNKPRNLTDEEIKDILKVIPNIRSAADTVSEYNTRSLKAMVKEQLQDIKITPLGIQDLKDEIVRQFSNVQCVPGETVGMTASASLIKPLSQLLLNSFHVAGSAKNVSAGIERVTELLNASETTKRLNATIYFKNQFLTFDDVIINKRPQFTEITVKDLVIGTPDIETFTKMEEPFWYSFYKTFYRKEFKSTEVLRLHLDINLLYAYKITMEDVVRVIEKDQPVVCVFSPMSLGIIDIYPIESAIISKLKSMDIVSYDKASLIFLSMAVIPALDKLKISGISGIDQIYPVEAPVLQIVKEEYLTGNVTDNSTKEWFLILNPIRIRITGITAEKLKKLCEVIGIEVTKLRPNYLVVKCESSPMQKIRDAVSQDEKEEKNYEKQRRFQPELPRKNISEISRYSKLVYADTTGSNLKELLSHPDVDSTRTYSNDLHEIYRALGIEAARTFLIKEFIDLLNDAGYIHPVHVELLADYMTNLGRVYGITFTGMSRQPVGALEKASFQKAMEVFKEASGFGESKPVTGTSASIFVGRKALIGTGFNETYIKPENLTRYQETRRQLLEDANMTIDINAFNDAIENMNVVTGADVAILEGAEEEMFSNIGVEKEPEISERGFMKETKREIKSEISEKPVKKENVLIKGPVLTAPELAEVANQYVMKSLPCPVDKPPTSHVISGNSVSLSVPIVPSPAKPPLYAPQMELPADILVEMEKLKPSIELGAKVAKPEIKPRPVKTFNLEDFMK